ncbi:hypothetical protein [Catellatospora methionotrophica]|uniref:hypothetical protein n=1 Tax=Catellatospora methionotrophica TaxID=121620 RepID=UPI00140CE0D9|nr:hypothetical protein [Catellatospora methionotrophica]
MKADRRQVLSIGVSAAIAAVTAPLVASAPAAAAGPQIIDLGLLPGTTHSGAADLNEHGVVVGSSSTANGPGQVARAFRWKNGVLSDLGTLGGQRTGASGINNNGWIVGSSTLADNVTTQAFLWKPGLGMVAVGPARSVGVDVNDAGVVVGYFFDQELGNRGFRWENGVTTLVENTNVPPGDPLYRRFLPTQMNNDGVIVGQNQDQAARWANGTVTLVGEGGAWDGGINAQGDVTISATWPQEIGYVWKADGTTRPLQIPAGADRINPVGINADGDAVGIASTGNTNISRAVFWSETGEVHGLPSLVPGAQAHAMRINNSSQIVGTAYVADGTYRAVLWKP